MADFNLLDIQPHQVSRDLRGYAVFFYGEPKSGKTTTATKFPKHLIAAFEKGYNTIPGAMAQPINSWGEFRKFLRQLKDPKVKERFETIIIDTADIAYDYCERYICSNNSVDTIGDIAYGKGYKLAAKEFDEALRMILQLNYGLVIISHAVDKTFKDQNGQEYNQIVPTLDSKPRNIVSRMADIIGYSRCIDLPDGGNEVRLFMRGTPRFVAGSRFKHTPDSIVFSYQNLVNAICDAIEKQAAEEGTQYFTEERNNLYVDMTTIELDFDALMAQFNEILSHIVNAVDEEVFAASWQPRITQIIEKYLGRGVKVSQCSREQVEALDLIVTELRDIMPS
jgi:hypothetical protein